MKVELEIADRLAAGLKARVDEYNLGSGSSVDAAGFLVAAVIPLEQWAVQYAAPTPAPEPQPPEPAPMVYVQGDEHA